jgi:hypothetical protein
MTTLDFPELKETEGTLNERRKKLHDIFTEAGPEMDMAKVKSVDGDSPAKVEAIRALNDEIDDLAKKAEGLRIVAKGAENALEYDDGTGTERATAPARPPSPRRASATCTSNRSRVTRRASRSTCPTSTSRRRC